MKTTFQQATPADKPALIHLLQAAKLPTSDLPEDLSGFTLASEGDQLVGSSGIENLGDCALLRSVAVAETHQNLGLGRQLQDHALAYARAHGLETVFLITTSAEKYFERLGFQRVERAEVPASVAKTEQFSSLCPSSAVVMRRMV
ncbi:MAG: arsenic resistance N-acetyltransferase ArsN2 [Bacteroidota bacterium]